MGLYNVLNAVAPCQNCGKDANFDIQFKYGEIWLHQYHLGETLTWGMPSVGSPTYRKVLIQGIGGPCPHCGVNYLEFDILLEENKLRSVIPIGVERPHESKDGFVALE